MAKLRVVLDAGAEEARAKPAGLMSKWRSLSRVTSTGRFIVEIDALRFFAIAGVVVHHIAGAAVEVGNAAGEKLSVVQEAVAHLLRHGAFGVQLFFAISGFILSLPFVEHFRMGKPKSPLSQYLFRRLTRLEPPYLASLGLLFLLKILVRGETASGLLPHLLASSVYGHMFAYHTVSLISGVAWSLEVEVQFYLLVPLLARVFQLSNNAIRRTVLIAACAGCVAFQRVAFSSAHSVLPIWMVSTLLGHLQFFLVGFLLADLFATVWRGSSAPSWWGDPLWCGAWLALGWTRLRGGNVSSFVEPFVVLAMYAGFFRGRARRFFCSSSFVVIGGMCYSIYLVHNPVILLVAKIFSFIRLGYTGRLLFMTVASLPLILLVSTAFFVLIERPCMDKHWPSKLMRYVRSMRRVNRSSERVDELGAAGYQDGAP